MIKVDKYYNDEQLELLNKEYETLEEYSIKRLNSLFHMKGRRPEPKNVCCVSDVSFGTDLVTNYYLDYEVDSFANIHRDTDNKTTAITLLEKSDDLEGGEIIIIMPFEKKHYENPYVFDSIIGKPVHQGMYVVPKVIHLKVGETILIEGNPHGVTKVTKGLRRVHVGWWL